MWTASELHALRRVAAYRRPDLIRSDWEYLAEDYEITLALAAWRSRPIHDRIAAVIDASYVLNPYDFPR